MCIRDRDGSVYFEGITDKAGKIRFKVPENGNYTFKEVSAPEGYYLNPEVYQFTVKGGTIEAVSYTHLDVYKRQVYGYGRQNLFSPPGRRRYQRADGYGLEPD